MPYATTSDNVRLYYEEAGSGSPILFIHEFAGDYRNWELQTRFFSRRHRCITYSARGYKPSDVPPDPKSYSYKHWVSDAMAVLDHLKIDKAHIVGLSMGAFGLMMNALAPGYDFFTYFFTLFLTPMLLLSGVFFPVDQLPAWLQTVANALPLKHAIDLARPLMLGRVPGAIALHVAVLVAYAIAAYYVALALTRRRLLK